MKIAVIGSGITGLGTAYALHKNHQVKLFEQSDRFGGHSNTVEVERDGKSFSVDTGFIVYNNLNYPNLKGLFDHLDVPTKWSDMSFGFSKNNGNVEYACDNLDKIFAQRLNLVNVNFIRGLLEILRFNREAPVELDRGSLETLSLGEYLSLKRHGKWFADNFILPLGSAIWSTPTSDILKFPAINFISFFRNHDLLMGMSQAQFRWRTVEGGSKVYVSKILNALGPKAIKNRKVCKVERVSNGVNLTFLDGSSEQFEQVICCTHAPQAMNILADLSEQEKALLSSFKTSENKAILHSDTSLMPKREKVWSSWNFFSYDQAKQEKLASVTYWMNRLQGFDKRYPFFVTLNPLKEPDSSTVYAEFHYNHPVFDKKTFEAQKSLNLIQGMGGIWYAGAWLGYGFHEDGLTSGLRVACSLGIKTSWAQKLEPFDNASNFLKAAE